MEAIFAGSWAIGRVLQAEVKRFANIDRQWIEIIKAARDNTNVVRLCCMDDKLANLLPHLRNYLEMCQKSLSEYSEGSNSTSIRPHLLSITTNVAALTFDATGPAVTVTGKALRPCSGPPGPWASAQHP